MKPISTTVQQLFNDSTNLSTTFQNPFKKPFNFLERVLLLLTEKKGGNG